MWLSLLLLWSCAGDDDVKPDDSAATDDSGGEGGEGGEGSGDSGPDPDTVALDGVCADDVHYGNFTVESTPSYAYINGAVTNGVVPATILTALTTVGDCTLWRRENPYCDPSCDPGYTCDFDGSCVEYPEGQDLGTVTVDGLLSPVSMDPVDPGALYFNTSLGNPPWDPGSLVTLQTGGGVYDPITLYGVAPDDLTVETTEWVVTQGQPLAVAWTAPASTSRAKVRVTVNIDQHGTTPVTAVCWFDDDGAAEVPSEVIDGLVTLGVTGFPSGTIARQTVDNAAAGAGCADLTLSSSRTPTVSVYGYTPCFSSEDCPEGTECNLELQRCE